jgi:hypothetical protein
MTTPEFELRHVVAAATPRLEAISNQDAAHPRGAGKWSRKEIVGHLHEVAFRTIPSDEPTTLEYFVRDYVAHLEHHLAQILGSIADLEPGERARE